MKRTNATLNNAQSNKEDEFYTRIIDIEKELQYYTDFLADKIVYCNCDDYRQSNFIKYFKGNFKALRLKKLIATNYDRNADELWGETSNAYKYEYDGLSETITNLKGDGSFLSNECIDILKICDIVITNPPFSLLKEFIPLMEKYNKQYAVIGNMNAITYKEIFTLIKTNKLWHGYNYVEDFIRPDNSIQSFGNIIWFTNVPIQKRTEPLLPKLSKTYSNAEYPTYINYNAINADKVKAIPVDYFEPMGVPITFLDSYNPNEFDIIGHTSTFEATWDLGVVGTPKTFVNDYLASGGKRHLTTHTALLGLYDKDGIAVLPYSRIIICRKKA